MRSLQAEIEAIAEQRRARLDEIRGIATRLEQLLAKAEPPGGPDGDEREESSGTAPES